MRFLRKSLFKERAGNTAMIFALLTPVLVLLGGGAVDLTNASMRQSNLQQAADAAAVGAVARSSPAYQAALLMTSDGTVTASNIQPNALAIFTANRQVSGDTAVPNFNVVVQKTGNTITSTVTASGTFKPSFLNLVGQNSVKLGTTATASDNYAPYMNFYLLLDNTPSQGVAATTTGITALQKLTPQGCAFACHDMNNQAGSNYAIAVNAKIPTRINNVAAAAANLLSTAQSTETANGSPAEFQVGVYDFGVAATSPTSAFVPNQVFPAVFGATSSDLASASKAAAAIDLMTVLANDPYDTDNDQYGDRDTNLQGALAFAAANLTSSGTGATAASPQRVLFFVSDGVMDTVNCGYTADGQSCRQITPIDPTPCNTLKAAGVKVAVLYTTYLPLPTNPFWQATVQSITNSPSQVAAAMSACASPGLYFEVNSDQDINTAMQALFQKVIASVKITH